jgi:hypothetical protein
MKRFLAFLVIFLLASCTLAPVFATTVQSAPLIVERSDNGSSIPVSLTIVKDNGEALAFVGILACLLLSCMVVCLFFLVKVMQKGLADITDTLKVPPLMYVPTKAEIPKATPKPRAKPAKAKTKKDPTEPEAA